MKPATSFFLVVIVSAAAFWGGIFFEKKRADLPGDTGETPYELQMSSVLNALIKQYTNVLQRGVNNAGTVLSENRDFVLSYYLDHDITNPVVSGVAEQYGELLAVDGFQVLDTDGKKVSTYGDMPEYISDTKDIEHIVDEQGTLWIGANSIAGIGKEQLLLRGWLRIDSSRLKQFSEVTQSELLVISGDDIILSTLTGIEKIHRTSPDRIIIDNEELSAISVQISDSLSLLSVGSAKGLKL